MSKLIVDTFRAQRRKNLGLSQDASWILVNAIEIIETYLKNFIKDTSTQPLQELFQTTQEPKYLWSGRNGQIVGSHSLTGPFWPVNGDKDKDMHFDYFTEMMGYALPGPQIMPTYEAKVFEEITNHLFGKIRESERFVNPHESILNAFDATKERNFGLALNFSQDNAGKVRFQAAVALVDVPSIELRITRDRNYNWYKVDTSTSLKEASTKEDPAGYM